MNSAIIWQNIIYVILWFILEREESLAYRGVTDPAYVVVGWPSMERYIAYRAPHVNLPVSPCAG